MGNSSLDLLLISFNASRLFFLGYVKITVHGCSGLVVNCDNFKQWIAAAVEAGTSEMMTRVWLKSVIGQIDMCPATTAGYVEICPILSYHLRVDQQSGSFPSGFLTENLYAFLISPMPAFVCLHKHLQHLIRIKTIFRNDVLYYEK
jgi:hypothetical protein